MYGRASHIVLPDEASDIRGCHQERQQRQLLQDSPSPQRYRPGPRCKEPNWSMHIKRSTSTVITEGLQAESLTCSIARTRSSAPRSKGNISCTVLPSDTCTSHCGQRAASAEH